MTEISSFNLLLALSISVLALFTVAVSDSKKSLTDFNFSFSAGISFPSTTPAAIEYAIIKPKGPPTTPAAAPAYASFLILSTCP